MSGKRATILGSILFLIGLAGVTWAVTVAGETYETIRLVVPRGDAADGRAAFVALSCHSCHAVAGDPEMPAPISAHPGPTLGPVQAAHGAVDAGSIASAIVSPSHMVVSEVDPASEEKLSPMGDFSDAMTVRQLVDLVAYVRSLGERD